MSQQSEIKALIQANKRRLHSLEVQKAQQGYDVKPHITTEIGDITARIAELQAKLAALGSEPTTNSVSTPPETISDSGLIAANTELRTALDRVNAILSKAESRIEELQAENAALQAKLNPSDKKRGNAVLFIGSLALLLIAVVLIVTDSGLSTAFGLSPLLTNEPPDKIVTAVITPTTVMTGTTMLRQTDSMTMVYVPAGEFQMGSDEGEDNEQPVHTQTLEAFWIDRTEVTNAQYNLCVEAGVCEISRHADNTTFNRAAHPVVGVSWYDGVAYCEWAGGRLPTEAEWEYAARGPESLKYPWGPEFDDSYVNYDKTGTGATQAVGSYPEGASWVGALDMIGNVWEWTQSIYLPYPYDDNDGRERLDISRPRVSRGGSWGTSEAYLYATARNKLDLTYQNTATGFRCVVPIE